jgi:hypothetical protein
MAANIPDQKLRLRPERRAVGAPLAGPQAAAESQIKRRTALRTRSRKPQR